MKLIKNTNTYSKKNTNTKCVHQWHPLTKMAINISLIDNKQMLITTLRY